MTKISLINFCGLDGSGKTTQASKLVTYLKKHNHDCEYIWLRTTERFTIPLIILFKILGISKSIDTESGKKIGVTNLSNHKSLQAIWKKILLFDLKVVCKSKVYNPIKRGKLLVVDRFIVDILVDLVVETKDEKVIEELGPQFLKLLPKNSKIIFLDIEPELAFKRSGEYDLKLLKWRKELYHKIIKSWNISIMNSKKSIEEIHSNVLKECGFY